MAFQQDKSDGGLSTREMEKRRYIANRKKSDENIFGQLGFMFYLFVLSGGEVEIKQQIRKKAIDGTNKLDFVCLKWETGVLTRDEVTEKEERKLPVKEEKELYVKKEMRNREKSERTRTIRKNVNDYFFNFLAEICHNLCYPCIKKGYAKRSLQKKESRIKFKSYVHNGAVLISEERIIELGKNWLIDVINMLKENQQESYSFSLSTIYYKIVEMGDLLSHEEGEIKESTENNQQDSHLENSDLEQIPSKDCQSSDVPTQSEIQTENTKILL